MKDPTNEVNTNTQGSSRRRRVLYRVVTCAGTLALLFLLVESYYRFIYDDSNGQGRLAKNYQRRYISLDKYGLRGSGLPLSGNKPNIIVLGDSFAYGSGLKNVSHRFSNVLQDRLPDYHVVNIAFPGWNTHTELEKLQEHTKGRHPGVKVDRVVLGYFYNDIEADVPDEIKRQSAGLHPPRRSRGIVDSVCEPLAGVSEFVNIHYYSLLAPQLQPNRLEMINSYYSNDAVFQRHSETLLKLKGFVEEELGAQLTIVAFPFMHSERYFRDDLGMYRVLAQWLTDNNVDKVDIRSDLLSEPLDSLVASPFDPHAGSFMHAEIAKRLMRRYSPADEH